jgi:hypothetical protein
LTDLETMLRVTRSEPHVAPARPRRREYVLASVALALAIAVIW